MYQSPVLMGLFFTVIIFMSMAVVWIFIVGLVHFPPSKRSRFQGKQEGVGKRKGHGPGKGNGGKRNDHPSRHRNPFHDTYRSAAEDDDDGGVVRMGVSPAARTASGFGKMAGKNDGAEQGNEVTFLWARLLAWFTALLSLAPPPSRGRRSFPDAPLLTSFPSTAYAIVTGMKRRTSSEWIRERAVFFSKDSAADDKVLPTQGGQETGRLNVDGMRALEAGTAEAAVSGYAKPRRDANEGVLRKSLSWLDRGLGLVDGAVDRVVEKVARWTDDEGGDEPLLLPVAKVGKVE